ncbi:hypothetical protein B0H13DRAFT_1886535 [Mycena leptocephala]|nr:hypothetical protein B0H13DRAFT_1886535 [Mycena leptocephala]
MPQSNLAQNSLSDECGEGTNLEAEMKVRAKARVRKIASVTVHNCFIGALSKVMVFGLFYLLVENRLGTKTFNLGSGTRFIKRQVPEIQYEPGLFVTRFVADLIPRKIFYQLCKFAARFTANVGTEGASENFLFWDLSRV